MKKGNSAKAGNKMNDLYESLPVIALSVGRVPSGHRILVAGCIKNPGITAGKTERTATGKTESLSNIKTTVPKKDCRFGSWNDFVAR